MSDWTNVTGSHNSKKASIKKILENVLGYKDYYLSSQARTFEFSVETDGVEAVKDIQKVIDAFKEFDPKAKIEMWATIRFD